MPRKYVRKQDAAPRAVWTQEDLTKALKAMTEGILSINEIGSKYGIPPRTLRRRFANKNTLKITLGKHPSLDFDNEADLVSELLKLENEGFVPTRDTLRRMAFEFAKHLRLEVPFCRVTRMAGKHWVVSFLERHPEVKVRKKRTVPSGVQGEEEQRVTDHFIHCTKKLAAEILASQPKKVNSVHEPSSSHVSDDPLLIKIERSDDESIEAPLENTYKLVEDIDIKIEKCSSSKDVLKGPLKEECYLPPNTSKDEYDGSDDPLLIKIEKSDDESIEAPSENTYKLVRDIDIEIEECSSSKDVLTGPLKQKSYLPPNTSKDECDEIDLLFLGYAAAVKKLGRRQQITVKQEIAEIIAIAELSEIE